MGNNLVKLNENVLKFGSIYNTDGKTRPGYYFSKNKIIYKGQEIPILINESCFQKLKFGYAKSNKRVFYNGKVLLMANPSTFSVIMRNNVKLLSKFPEKNKSFSKLNCVLGMDYVHNTKRVYLKDTIIHEES